MVPHSPPPLGISSLLCSLWCAGNPWRRRGEGEREITKRNNKNKDDNKKKLCADFPSQEFLLLFVIYLWFLGFAWFGWLFWKDPSVVGACMLFFVCLFYFFYNYFLIFFHGNFVCLNCSNAWFLSSRDGQDGTDDCLIQNLINEETLKLQQIKTKKITTISLMIYISLSQIHKK